MEETDLKMASDFLSHFTGRQIFVAMTDDNSRPPIHYHKDLDKCSDILHRQNNKDHGIFFTVNELHKELDEDATKKRTGKMFYRARTLFLDDDVIRKQPRTDFPLIPNLIVSTSSGKYHYYWLIKDGIYDKDLYLSVQRSLVHMYEGDSNVKDVTRYLRLPGFRHRKNGNNRIVTYTDNEIEPYDFEELRKSFGQISATSSVSSASATGASDSDADSDSKTIEETQNLIVTGVEFHQSILSLSYQYAKEGMKAKYIVNYIEALMNQVPDALKDDRWQARYNDIERVVRGAFESIYGDNVDLSSLEVDYDKYSSTAIPWPPGLLGALADDAYDMALYQYKEVALVSAIGLVAGVTGRKFNVSGTGLNVYLTLLMKTGMGKDSISKFITRTLNSLNDVGLSSSFIGAKRFTGPKAVINHMKDARSKICVFTEAGILMRSTSGDQDGLTRLLLGLYSCSGQYDYSGQEEFSSNEGRIDSLRAPALSIISEATPETLLDVLRDSGALENGHLPRQSIFRLEGNKPYPNIKMKTKLSKPVQSRLRELVAKCAQVQAVNDFECWDFEYASDIEEDVHKFAIYCVDIENAHRMEDSIKSIMASRMFLKALKFAALASTINHTELVIKKPEWEWAKKLALFEFESIDGMFQGSGFNNVFDDLAKSVVGSAIVRMLRNEYKDRNISLTKQQRDVQHVPFHNLNQCLRKSNRLKYNNFIDSPTDGLRNVLNYMVEAGYLKEIVQDQGNGQQSSYSRNKRGAVYKVTNLFASVMAEQA